MYVRMGTLALGNRQQLATTMSAEKYIELPTVRSPHQFGKNSSTYGQHGKYIELNWFDPLLSIPVSSDIKSFRDDLGPNTYGKRIQNFI